MQFISVLEVLIPEVISSQTFRTNFVPFINFYGVTCVEIQCHLNIT
jgi:hypothetical protein